MTALLHSPIIILALISGPLFNHSEVLTNNAGVDALTKGEREEALKQFSRAQSGDPQNPTVHYNLGETFYEEGAYDKALKEFQSATVTSKAESDENVFKKGLYNTGNTLFQSARQAEKENPQASSSLYGQSAAAFAEALRQDPDDGDARYNLQLTLEKIKELKKQNQDQEEKKDNKKENDKKQKDAKKDPQNQQKPDRSKDKNQQPENQKQENRKMSRAEVERILQSVQEKEMQDKMKGQVSIQDNDEW